MAYEPVRHHRRSLRLQGHDYSQAGAYFVTICTHNRACWFGQVVAGGMRLNDAGQWLRNLWITWPERFAGVASDAFVIMPNHFHGIVSIHPVGAQLIAPHDRGAMKHGAMNRAPTVGEIIRAFKAAATRGLRQAGVPQFAWQRNYYEHIIRNEASLGRIRQYIADNPSRWAQDRENPALATCGAAACRDKSGCDTSGRDESRPTTRPR
ncbi:MAG: hypothetical protein Q8L45_02120 [Xanthomonadaceae bacterium]|nr:hypothetical protein [Xanthomonadaceae bacterium]MDZ4379700.1 transposase [Xanthomonadaceae bacterium]